MPVFDPTSSILTGGVVDIDGLLSTLKDKLPAKVVETAVNKIGSPISTTSSSFTTVTDGSDPASITLSLDAAGDEVIVLLAEMGVSSDSAGHSIEAEIHDGLSQIAVRRLFITDASTAYDGMDKQIIIPKLIIGGVSGSKTYSLRWKRVSGTGTLKCGYYSIMGIVLKYR